MPVFLFILFDLSICNRWVHLSGGIPNLVTGMTVDSRVASMFRRDMYARWDGSFSMATSHRSRNHSNTESKKLQPGRT